MSAAYDAHEVDWAWLDSFRWTPEIRADYAARARALALRYSTGEPTNALGRWPRGRCQDCRRPVAVRFRLGPRLLCKTDADFRLRVARELAELE